QRLRALHEGAWSVSARTFKPNETVDFVVVGSGPAGSGIARELSKAGFTVLVMEQGPRVSAGEFEHDELKYQLLHGITNDPAVSPQTFRRTPDMEATRPGNSLSPYNNPLVYARIVGGSGMHFTAN